MITKTVPSGGTTNMAYDKLDRPVLTTDANGFKTFTRYDILSRPVVTGKYKGSASPSTSNPLFEIPNTTAPHYYTSVSFPTDNNLDVYKVLYYDDYDLNNDGSTPSNESYTNPAESPYETTAFLRTRGKPTASRTGILLNNGAAPTTFLTTRTYYDKEFSVIQVNKQNHISGADITSSAYDFANRLVKSRRDHSATPPGGTAKNYTIREEYVFDLAGRVIYVVHQIGSQKKEIIAGSKYDELGRLTEKNLHASNFTGSPIPTYSTPAYNYLQSLDYSYNIRGWLTGINDPTSCALQGGDVLADLFYLGLDYESTTNGASPQYNGNIAAMQWRTNLSACNTRNQYRFSYDAANRLKTADHYTHNGTAWTFTNNYTESNLVYDLNGNIKSYNRRGVLTGGTIGQIDLLYYTYGDPLRPDRLTQMADGGDGLKGFKRTTGLTGDHYTYDLNGNMVQDKHKGFVYTYNYLNLPSTMTNGANVITMTYTADGEKLSKAVTGGGATKNYVSGIEYSGANVEAIYHAEGRLTPNGTDFHYEYTLKDHLGNARVIFRAISNGTAIQTLQENHYYPFGMEMEGAWQAQVGVENQYQYNGKELNEDFGLGLMDYGARWYDGALGRFPSVDPVIEKFTFLTPYNYASNSPVSNIDLWGLQGFSMHHLWNALGFTSRGINQIHEAANKVLPSSETRQRINLATEGGKTIGFGVIGSIGAIGGAEFTAGASITALPFTFGEIGIGGARVYDAFFSDNPFAEKPIHKAGSLLGLLAYNNDSEYAPQLDALGQFAPGIVTGGNILGGMKSAVETISHISRGKMIDASFSALNAIDAYQDAKGVIDATNSALGVSRPEKISISKELKEKALKNYNVSKVNVVYTTKDINEIKAFLDNLKPASTNK